MAHQLHWTAKSRASFLCGLRYFTLTHIEKEGSGRSSLSGFPRNEASMGAEFRGKTVQTASPEPSLSMCVQEKTRTKQEKEKKTQTTSNN